MSRRRRTGGRFFVGDDPRSFPDEGPAISLALTLASRATQDVTLYVREIGQTVARARVTRTGRVITTERITP